MITQENLKKLLNYNPETGVFTWAVDVNTITKKGTIANNKMKNGYTRVGVNYKRYLAHRLAWLYMTGEWPKNEIDHINGIRDDNRWCNLREATIQQNRANVGLKKSNTSGVKGVHWSKFRKKWVCAIRENGKKKHLGAFDDLMLAEKVYIEYAKKIHGDFFRNITKGAMI